MLSKAKETSVVRVNIRMMRRAKEKVNRSMHGKDSILAEVNFTINGVVVWKLRFLIVRIRASLLGIKNLTSFISRLLGI